MKRAEILEAARVCVCGERERDYGTPENNFETIGLLWGVYPRAAHPELAKVMTINHITAKDVAEALSKAVGTELDKRKVELERDIKDFGTYSAAVKLHPGVSAAFKVKVEEL